MHTEATPRTLFAPRILFFSGGTALKETAAAIAKETRNSFHLVTPFDSGGSSRALREAFNMPAVGDARSRIMALADATLPGNAEIYTLFAYRLPANEPQERLLKEFFALIRGSHPLIRQIPAPANGIIRDALAWFALRMPENFPLAGANIGNIVLTAGYLRHKRRLSPVIALFSRLVRARGGVRTVVEDPAHLAVRLASGEIIIGQHRFTGKNGPCVTSPITDIWLTESEESYEPISLELPSRQKRLIRNSRALCYPIGSFYSSVIANLLPSGVGEAIAACRGPKIFTPNLGHDPELLGHTVADQITRVITILTKDVPGAAPTDFITHIIMDAQNGVYEGGIPEDTLKTLGITLVTAPLAQTKGAYAHPKLLSAALLSTSEG